MYTATTGRVYRNKPGKPLGTRKSTAHAQKGTGKVLTPLQKFKAIEDKLPSLPPHPAVLPEILLIERIVSENLPPVFGIPASLSRYIH